MLSGEQKIFLTQACQDRWREENGIIYVSGNVSISNFTKISVQFGKVSGFFECRNNKLKTLERGPIIVGWHYGCHQNILTNLIGAPEICDGNFYCDQNRLTSLEGCPRFIKGDLRCENNPALSILFGLREVKGIIQYDNTNDLNEWIIQQARKDIYVTYEDIAKWINLNNKLEFLRNAQPEIQRYFSNYIIKAIELNLC